MDSVTLYGLLSLKKSLPAPLLYKYLKLYFSNNFIVLFCMPDF